MSMDYEKRAAEILGNAEKELRKLIAEAASSGDYESVAKLAETASSTRYVHGNRSSTASLQRNGVATGAKKATKRKAKRRSSKKATYPKFATANESLIKIAWSKAKKSEYRHKSPRAALHALSRSMDLEFESTELISMESMLPIANQESGSEFPDYQSYLCLAWLRDIGVVEQQGRDGYRKSTNKTIFEAANEAWKTLPNDKRK